MKKGRVSRSPRNIHQLVRAREKSILSSQYVNSPYNQHNLQNAFSKGCTKKDEEQQQTNQNPVTIKTQNQGFQVDSRTFNTPQAETHRQSRNSPKRLEKYQPPIETSRNPSAGRNSRKSPRPNFSTPDQSTPLQILQKNYITSNQKFFKQSQQILQQSKCQRNSLNIRSGSSKRQNSKNVKKQRGKNADCNGEWVINRYPFNNKGLKKIQVDHYMQQSINVNQSPQFNTLSHFNRCVPTHQLSPCQKVIDQDSKQHTFTQLSIKKRNKKKQKTKNQLSFDYENGSISMQSNIEISSKMDQYPLKQKSNQRSESPDRKTQKQAWNRVQQIANQKKYSSIAAAIKKSEEEATQKVILRNDINRLQQPLPYRIIAMSNNEQVNDNQPLYRITQSKQSRDERETMVSPRSPHILKNKLMMQNKTSQNISAASSRIRPVTEDIKSEIEDRLTSRSCFGRPLQSIIKPQVCLQIIQNCSSFDKETEDKNQKEIVTLHEGALQLSTLTMITNIEVNEKDQIKKGGKKDRKAKPREEQKIFNDDKNKNFKHFQQKRNDMVRKIQCKLKSPQKDTKLRKKNAFTTYAVNKLHAQQQKKVQKIYNNHPQNKQQHQVNFKTEPSDQIRQSIVGPYIAYKMRKQSSVSQNIIPMQNDFKSIKEDNFDTKKLQKNFSSNQKTGQFGALMLLDDSQVTNISLRKSPQFNANAITNQFHPDLHQQKQIIQVKQANKVQENPNKKLQGSNNIRKQSKSRIHALSEKKISSIYEDLDEETNIRNKSSLKQSLSLYPSKDVIIFPNMHTIQPQPIENQKIIASSTNKMNQQMKSKTGIKSNAKIRQNKAVTNTKKQSKKDKIQHEYYSFSQKKQSIRQNTVSTGQLASTTKTEQFQKARKELNLSKPMKESIGSITLSSLGKRLPNQIISKQGGRLHRNGKSCITLGLQNQPIQNDIKKKKLNDRQEDYNQRNIKTGSSVSKRLYNNEQENRSPLRSNNVFIASQVLNTDFMKIPPKKSLQKGQINRSITPRKSIDRGQSNRSATPRKGSYRRQVNLTPPKIQQSQMNSDLLNIKNKSTKAQSKASFKQQKKMQKAQKKYSKEKAKQVLQEAKQTLNKNSKANTNRSNNHRNSNSISHLRQSVSNHSQNNVNECELISTLPVNPLTDAKGRITQQELNPKEEYQIRKENKNLNNSFSPINTTNDFSFVKKTKQNFAKRRFSKKQDKQQKKQDKSNSKLSSHNHNSSVTQAFAASTTSSIQQTISQHQNTSSPIRDIKSKIMRDFNTKYHGLQRQQHIDQLISNKNQRSSKMGRQISSTHMTIMKNYITKMNLKSQTLVFVFRSGDQYIRRAFLRKGYFQNSVKNSSLFDVKWQYTDAQFDYNTLRAGQYYNHFPGNRQITTKSGLNNILRNNPDASQFAPRSFDFQDMKQIDEFVQNFEETAIFNVIKQHANLFMKNHGRIIRKVEKAFKILDKTKVNYKMWKDVIKQKLRETVLQQTCSYNLNIKKLRRSMLSQKRLSENNRHSVDSYRITSPSLLTEYLIVKIHKLLYQTLPQYRIDGSKNIWIVKPGYDARGHNIYCINDLKQVVNTGKKMQSAKIVQKYIETPFLIPRQITPSSSLPNSNMINNASTTTTASSTTANQKLQQQPKQLISGEKRKFDIRQWVLVTSFDPLIIYCYQSAYLRLCGSSFDLDDVHDLFKHLTNYTIQKGNSNVVNVKQDLIMSTQAFEQYVRTQHPGFQKSSILSSYFKKFSWIKDIFPKISQIATRVLKSGAQSIQHRNNCFQLYGFDFVIDDRMAPWLIEVNLSPACAERTQWLRNMLQKMSDGLLATIELDKLKQSDQGKLQLQQFIKICGWEKTYDQRTMDRDWINLNANNNNPLQNCNQINVNDGINQFQMQIVGEKLKGKQERYYKRRDMYQRMKDGPLKIQLAWKRYLAR